MPNDFDVVIVGAGPAGSWAAFRLANDGARVALIDGSHPREKPCGGGLSARTLEVLSPVATRLPPAVRAASARFTTSGLTATLGLRWPEGAVPALAIASRSAFDASLLDAARESGAQHIARRVSAVERVEQGWRVAADGQRITAAWLIGADGANSLVRRRVLTAFARQDLSIASGFYVRDLSGTEIDIEFTDSPPGYLWSFPRPDHLAVGTCGQADETSSRDLLEGTRRWIHAHTRAPVSALARYSWPIPSLTDASLSTDRPAGDRWLLVGDAAGLVDPITREGIYFALRSGEFAARSIFGARAGATYARLIRTRMHPELLHASRIKSKFFGPTFRPLLVRALQRSAGIRAIMRDLIAGRQTYRGLRRRLLLTGDVRLAVSYLRLAAGARSR